MIIERQEDVTPAVLKELERAPNARFKEIMGAFIAHMHDFVREFEAHRGRVPHRDELRRGARQGEQRVRTTRRC